MFSIDQFLLHKCDISPISKLMKLEDICKSYGSTSNCGISKDGKKNIRKSLKRNRERKLKEEITDKANLLKKPKVITNMHNNIDNKILSNKYISKNIISLSNANQDKNAEAIINNSIVLVKKLSPSVMEDKSLYVDELTKSILKTKVATVPFAKHKIKRDTKQCVEKHVDNNKDKTFINGSECNTGAVGRNIQAMDFLSSGNISHQNVDAIKELKTPKCNTKTLKYMKQRKEMLDGVIAQTDGDDEYFKENHEQCNITKLIEDWDSEDDSAITFNTPTIKLKPTINITPRMRLLQKWTETNNISSPSVMSILKKPNPSKQKDSALQVYYHLIKKKKRRKNSNIKKVDQMFEKKADLLKLPELDDSQNLGTSMEDYFNDSY